MRIKEMITQDLSGWNFNNFFPLLRQEMYRKNKREFEFQGCALAEPGGPWRLTFALGRLENHRFFIQIICWAP